MKLDTSSLAYTQWECKYHIVFALKYRRQIIYGKIKQDVGQIIRKLCEYKGVEIIEAEACKDHIHMLVSLPPQYSVSQFMGYLKGKSRRAIEQYIRNQLQEDYADDQMSIKEHVDPFTREPVKGGK